MKAQKIGPRYQACAVPTPHLVRHAAMGNPEWSVCWVGSRGPVHGFRRAYWQGLNCAQQARASVLSRFRQRRRLHAHKKAPPTGNVDGAKTSANPRAGEVGARRCPTHRSLRVRATRQWFRAYSVVKPHKCGAGSVRETAARLRPRAGVGLSSDDGRCPASKGVKAPMSECDPHHSLS
jgi:hypothetical protein